jgi:hypothetical protein
MGSRALGCARKGEVTMRWLQAAGVAAVALALAAPAAAAPKKPKPPPPPPDTAADCTFSAEADVPDYLVLATLILRVDCATVKQQITITASEFTRDGASLPLIPFDTRVCSNTGTCIYGIDLFSYDNHPVAFPGDQRYCTRGSGLVGGTVLGPASVCETDSRI